jgi:hypothetical protein
MHKTVPGTVTDEQRPLGASPLSTRGSQEPRVNRSAGTTAAGDTTVTSGIRHSHHISPGTGRTRCLKPTTPTPSKAPANQQTRHKKRGRCQRTIPARGSLPRAYSSAMHELLVRPSAYGRPLGASPLSTRASQEPRVNRSAGTTAAGDTTVTSGIRHSHHIPPGTGRTRCLKPTTPTPSKAPANQQTRHKKRGRCPRTIPVPRVTPPRLLLRAYSSAMQ